MKKIKDTERAPMTYQEFKRSKTLGIVGLLESPVSFETLADSLTFVNDKSKIQAERLRERNIRYQGEGDDLKNYYTRAGMIDYNTDPIYNNTKKAYFWVVSATESDTKRTHSVIPRAIIDTMVNLLGIPEIGVGSETGPLHGLGEKLNKILKDNNFKFLLKQKARPLTLVEGWGAWKIDFDLGFRNTPILRYYRAEKVDFCYKNDSLVAIIYKDFYQSADNKNYVLFETRRLVREENNKISLLIEKELFQDIGGDILKPVELKELPELRDNKPVWIIHGLRSFLGYPSIYFGDSSEEEYGRSIYKGKIDLFDDLDQCLSQASNTVRRSTPIEYFDELYLEKDARTGLGKMPHVYDRKYIKYHGRRSGDGITGADPITVTQPNVDINQYDAHATSITLEILSGYMAPATMGLDIAKKDNAEAQREKEKVTIFTRKTMIEAEENIVQTICNDLLIANEIMNSADNSFTCDDYSVYVKYEEFADLSFEGRLDTVLDGWNSGLISDRRALKMLHGNSLSNEAFEEELEFVKEKREKDEQINAPQNQGEFGIMGADGDGYNTDGMNYDDDTETERISEFAERGIR